MAQKRMIDKKISVSEQISNLSLEAQLLFTWMIPHADDVGVLPYSARTIKALVIPMLDIPIAKVEELLESIRNQNLIDVFQHEGFKYWRVKAFLKNQTLKKDRQPQTIFGFKCSKKPEDSWDELLKLIPSNGIHLEDTGNHLDTEVKRREVKLSKDNTPKGVELRSFGDPKINTCVSHLTERLGGSPDGSKEQNRRFCNLLLRAVEKDYPDKGPPDKLVCVLIDIALKDPFHAKNATSFKYLYYNRQKIIQSAKTHQSKVITI